MTERKISQLEQVLRSGRFAITSELNPPDSADPEDVYRAAMILAGFCDGINAVDASGANCHMSSLSICALLTRAGYEPVYQISARDRNRIAIQGDILGASAMGVHNLLAITGDDVSAGDQPEAKPVFDFDSIQLLRTARLMRDESIFLSGRKITTPPDLFLGAAANPFAPPYDWRAQRLAKKIAAGAQFIQTQYCFDVPRFKEYMRQVRDFRLHEQAYILVGVGPLRSAGAANFMRTKVPGIVIPDEIVDRLKKTPKKQQQAEGKQICMEIIEQVKEIEGVSGIHIMAYRQEELVAEIVMESGLLPRK
ncbi:MAG: methylenetetrahydrofolate reductase [Anaerolineae bacterium]|mgnify:FL=1|jgi:methylenetetrahydrofolate reductase (NADPH)|nr:methylenetetrahydrofolate reductase [Anaerolineae bacterium]